MKNFNTVLITWIKNSSIFILIKIIKSKGLFLKFIWLIYMLLSATAGSYYIYQSVCSYFSYPIITSIQSINEKFAEFPIIDFCFFDNITNISDYFRNSIVDCRFGRDLSCKREFDSYFYKYYPNCYSINGNKNESFKSYVGGKTDFFSILFKSNFSFYVYLTNKTSYKIIDYDIILSPGFLVEAALEKTIEKKLELPYNFCIKNESNFAFNKTILDIFSSNNLSYEYQNCINICFAFYYIENNNPCNLSNDSIDYLMYFDNGFWFYNSNQSECVFNEKKLFFKLDHSEKCSKYCPIDCETINYLVNIKTYSIQKIYKENYMKFKIYFTRIQYTLIEQQAKISTSDLLANIGGTFSLFLGLSVINLFEITELLFDLIIYLRKKI